MYSTTLYLDNECEDLYSRYVINASNGFIFSIQLTHNLESLRSSELISYIIVN